MWQQAFVPLAPGKQRQGNPGSSDSGTDPVSKVSWRGTEDPLAREHPQAHVHDMQEHTHKTHNTAHEHPYTRVHDTQEHTHNTHTKPLLLTSPWPDL